MGAQTAPAAGKAPLPAQLRHVFGAGRRGGCPGRKPWQHRHGLGQVPSSKPAVGLARWRLRLASHPAYCANPPCRCLLPPLLASHKKELLLTSPLPARRAPEGQEGDRRQVAGTGHRSRSAGGSRRG